MSALHVLEVETHHILERVKAISCRLKINEFLDFLDVGLSFESSKKRHSF